MKITDFNCLSVSKITRSIELIDEFAAGGQEYDYLVIKDWFHTIEDNYYDGYKVSLCIKEREKESDYCIYDLTMTELRQVENSGVFDWDKVYSKQDKPETLLQSISYTLKKFDLEKIAEDEMIPLDYPIRLRAQGSWNREEIGNRFVWLESVGYGTYMNTEYGETDDYIISHILVKKIERIKSTDELLEEEIASLDEIIAKGNEDISEMFRGVDLNGEKVHHRKWGECEITEWDGEKRYAKLKYGELLTGIISLDVAVKNKVMTFANPGIMRFFEETERLKEIIITAEKRKSRLMSVTDHYTKWAILHGYEE